MANNSSPHVEVSNQSADSNEVKIERSNDTYLADLQSTLSSCYEDDTFSDVVLYCRQPSYLPDNSNGWVGIKANLSVLAAAVPYIKRIVEKTNLLDYCLVMDGFTYEEVYTLVHYSYTGVVDPCLKEAVNLEQIIKTFDLPLQLESESVSVDEEMISTAVDEENIEWISIEDVAENQQVVSLSQDSDPDGKEDANNDAITHSRTCDVCEKVFARPALMLNHRRIHTGEKPFTCHICQKSYREKSHLTRHARSHTDNAKPYNCEICEKSFAHHFNMVQHKLTHSGFKRLLCSTCGYRCFQASDLKKHMRTHTGEKPYNCDICGKGFTQRVSCLKHKQSVHREEMAETTAT